MRTLFTSLLLSLSILMFADESPLQDEGFGDAQQQEENIQEWIRSEYYAMPFSGKNEGLVKEALQGKTSSEKKSVIFFTESKEALNKDLKNELFGLEACTKAVPFGSYSWWHLYKANFGFEKIYVKFPSSPTITQSSTMLVAFAYEYNVLYSLAAYYPPIGSIEPILYFDNALFNASQPPFVLLSHAIYQVNGCYVLDYLMHDTFKNLLVKTRVVVTPFNAYTLQTVSTYGISSRFEYFIDSFKIKLAH